MAKNKPVAPVVASPLPELDTEVKGLVAASTKITVADGDSLTVKADQLDNAANVLTLTRAAIKKIDDETKALIEKTVPLEVAKKLAELDKEKKKLKKAAEAVNTSLSEALLAAYALGTLTDEGITSKAGCKLTVAGKVDIEITDESSLAEQFFYPAKPNLDAIREALEADARRRAAAKELDLPTPEPTIHGAELTRKIYFITKLPDVIEN